MLAVVQHKFEFRGDAPGSQSVTAGERNHVLGIRGVAIEHSFRHWRLTSSRLKHARRSNSRLQIGSTCTIEELEIVSDSLLAF